MDTIVRGTTDELLVIVYQCNRSNCLLMSHKFLQKFRITDIRNIPHLHDKKHRDHMTFTQLFDDDVAINLSFPLRAIVQISNSCGWNVLTKESFTAVSSLTFVSWFQISAKLVASAITLGFTSSHILMVASNEALNSHFSLFTKCSLRTSPRCALIARSSVPEATSHT